MIGEDAQAQGERVAPVHATGVKQRRLFRAKDHPDISVSKIVDVTIVIVDTNIIAASPWLDGKAWISLIEHGAEWGVRIVVPGICQPE